MTMSAFATQQDLFRIARDEALSRNAKLSRSAIEREGSDSNILVAGGSAMAEEIVAELDLVAAALFLDSAEEADLDRLVYDRYGLVRLPATNGLCTAQFAFANIENPSPFTIPAGLTLSTPDGVDYVTTESQLFPAGTTGAILVAIRSVLAGADQQIAQGSLTIISGQIDGADSRLVVVNAVASVGAADAEKDAALRTRARNFFTNARRGTLNAIEQGALSVGGVTKAKTFEVLDALGRPARFVILMVTDQYTDLLAVLNQVPATYQQQSQQLAQAVYNGLYDVRAGGIYVNVQVAQIVLQPVRLSLQFIAGVNVDAVAVRARAAVVNAINSLKPGEPMTLDAIRSALRTVTGLLYSGGEILSPVGDVVPTLLQAVRTTLAIVTAGSVQTDQPISPSTNPDAFNAAGG